MGVRVGVRLRRGGGVRWKEEEEEERRDCEREWRDLWGNGGRDRQRKEEKGRIRMRDEN